MGLELARPPVAPYGPPMPAIAPYGPMGPMGAHGPPLGPPWPLLATKFRHLVSPGEYLTIICRIRYCIHKWYLTNTVLQGLQRSI